MEEKFYKVNRKQFYRLAKNWYSQKKPWKYLCLLSWFFILIGVAAIVVMCIQAADPTVPSLDARVLLVLAGFILAVLPFIFAYVTQSQAKRILGKPYTGMQMMFLLTNRSGIQFGYHEKFNRKWRLNTMVDQIAYENIHHVELNQKSRLVTVVGRTERVEYINMQQDRIGYSFTDGQFGDMASFSFFLAIENEQEFWDELEKRGVKVTFTEG